MSKILCFTFRFIQPFPLFHGRADAANPEWPPSPMRVFQTLINAAASRCRGHLLEEGIREVIDAIEPIRPIIIAPAARPATVGYRSYVPHNQADLVSAAWNRGSLETTIAPHRMEKDYRPTQIEVIGDQLPAVHYLYKLDCPTEICQQLFEDIRPCVRSISALGWGLDQVVADAILIEPSDSASLPGQRWSPAERGSRRLRVQKKGSFSNLVMRHEKFLNRIVNGNFTPVPPLSVFDVVSYRREDEPISKPFAVFELRNMDGSRASYPHGRLIHISGMVRHLAIKAMKKAPPGGFADDWVETYVAGHAIEKSGEHRQLSYLPLPSVGHEHTDPSIRRVMIVAPVGDEHLLNYITKRLSGRQLEPESGEFADKEPPLLVPVRHDNIANIYTKSAKVWHSFTPVILPGHDDHNPDKRRVLIEKALRQAGITQPCEFEASAFSRFRKSYSAHKYGKDKRPQGYIRPGYLLSQTAIHLTLRFREEVPGPIAVGAGRHCGLGLFVPGE